MPHVATASAAALKAWKAVSPEQKKIINEFFKGSEKAAEKVTKDTLKKYEKVAERQINRGKDNNGEQQRRVGIIKETLTDAEK